MKRIYNPFPDLQKKKRFRKDTFRSTHLEISNKVLNLN